MEGEKGFLFQANSALLKSGCLRTAWCASLGEDAEKKICIIICILFSVQYAIYHIYPSKLVFCA